ncbi:MAG: hypothetical protein KAW09_04495, partial [Thermoplasmata archaeon]|nr:hypothetical protein [Thermoplasmata archaeon]
GVDCYFNVTVDNNDFLNLQAHGVRFLQTIYRYAHVRLEYTNNLFDGSSLWTEYGFHHQAGPLYTDDSIPSSFTLTVVSNDFYDLLFAGVRFNGNVYGFRNVTLTIEGNEILNRISNYMDYGIYFAGGMYYNSNDYDNYYTVSIRQNTIRDIWYQGIYFSSSSATYGFRHVDIRIHDNVMENIISPSYMDYGIMWYYTVYYARNDVGSSFNLDITGNHFQDLDEDAIAFKYNPGVDIGYFSNASINIQDNVFLNTISNYLRHGLFLRPVYFLSTAFDNSIDITIVNNTCDSLNDYCINFNSQTGYDFEGYRNVRLTISQNNFRNTLGNWMDYGVYIHGFEYGDSSYYANSLDIDIHDNNVENLTAYGVYFHGSIYYYSIVDIDITDNYFRDVYNNLDRGVYFPNTIYYNSDNEGAFHFRSVRNKAYDLLYDAIRFDGNIYNFRNATVLIQDCEFVNTISNWMDNGIY